mmetsp:Transcript_55849/g.169990  ORF Transcript_55849/g.169990 Transcript_55849/m.169990 type:complete len:216 (+) Transcript_55849:528-1175(+)
MLTQKATCCTLAPMRSRSTMICSSSPSPSPVRLSPVCWMPCAADSSRPKNTASRSWPFPSNSTAETSKSTSPSSTSQPRPTVICPMLMGRSNTPPFSIAKATFCREGASGMNVRMTWESVGKMSMKCRPPWAGTSISRSRQPEAPRTMAATTSTAPVLRSMAKRVTSWSSRSSKRINCPLATSCKEPPEYAATTNTKRSTCSGNLRKFAHTISST